jgi:DNA topoisomerase VI subunit B
VREFMGGLDAESLSKISLKVAINILPYHLTSEKLAIAVRYVQEQRGSEEALRVLRYFLDNVDSWNEQSVRSLTINQFLNNLAAQVSSLTGLPRDDIRTELAHYSTTDGLTRQWSKYVMGSLRIPGTPYSSPYSASY